MYCDYYNFRYYKKFQIPDMVRLKLKLVQSSISVAHANNTLIVTVCTSAYDPPIT